MARVVFGGYMARYPLGGMMSCGLQFLLGLRDLGHDVHFLEYGFYENACYDPRTQTSSDDPSYGLAVLGALLQEFDLKDRWCFIDVKGEHYGYSKAKLKSVLNDCDVFIDYGAHGSLLPMISPSTTTVLVDGEPTYTQIKFQKALDVGEPIPRYDFYYSIGANIGSTRCPSPTAGIDWMHLPAPVSTRAFTTRSLCRSGPICTVMNWQSHGPIELRGKTYYQKDVEFEKFLELPRHVDHHLEVAVSGPAPRARLHEYGWRHVDAQAVTATFKSYRDYIWSSAAEFSVAKNVFVSTTNGWFSDRSAAYLASGRPVVVQNTGTEDYVPSGKGFFAVESEEEAATALRAILVDPAIHEKAAVELAHDIFESELVLGRMMARI